MTQITTQTAFGTDEETTLNTINTRIEDLRDAALERMDIQEIVKQARLASKEDYMEARTRALTLVIEWFNTHVDHDEFDTDVFVEARRQVLAHVVNEVNVFYD